MSKPLPPFAVQKLFYSASAACFVLFLITCQASAAVLHSQDFSAAPSNLSSGKWNASIVDGVVPVAGVWNAAGGFATSTNSGSGTVQANTQYSFDGAELTGFGALYDSVSGTIGGGNVSGSLYLRFNVQMLHPTPGNLFNHFGGLQLHRGTTSNRSNLDAFSTQGAMLLGKQWGLWAYSYLLHGNVAADLNAVGLPDPAPYSNVNGDWHTIVARINYNAAAADAATVWFDPDFNLTEAEQSAALTTTLATGSGNLSFNTFVLRAGNNGMSANFDDIVFGTDTIDVGFAPVPEPASWSLVLVAIACCGHRIRRKQFHGN